MMLVSEFKRIAVVGTSCSGKTTMARRLGRLLNIPHIELDQLNWLPGWRMRDRDEFRDLLDKETDADRWIIDGNYYKHQDIFLPKATHVVWLNYSFVFIFGRGLMRTINRIWTKKELFNGCYETFGQSFLSRDSILWWIIKTFPKNRQRYPTLPNREEFSNIRLIELRSQREADLLLESIQK